MWCSSRLYILAPILFLLYINDLSNISKKLKFILFADDTNVFYSDTTVEKVVGVINSELKYLSLWFKINKLSLNVKKSNYMLFMKNNCKLNTDLYIDDTKLEKVNVTKFLGVYVDEYLTWNAQIQHVCRNISKNVSILYKAKNKLDRSSLHTLYCSMIFALSYICM